MLAGVLPLQLIPIEKVPLVTFSRNIAPPIMPLTWQPSLLCLVSVLLLKSALPWSVKPPVFINSVSFLGQGLHPNRCRRRRTIAKQGLTLIK